MPPEYRSEARMLVHRFAEYTEARRTGPEGHRTGDEAGFSVLLALVALSLMSLLGIFVALESSTEVRISDNSESHLRATQAALAGTHHARELLTGLDFDDLLKGPDGVSDAIPGNILRSRSIGFRNPLPWPAAQALAVIDPSSSVAGMADDGLIHSPARAGRSGVILVPLTGLALRSPDPYGAGAMISARYFVKVADNNGEPSELAADPDDDPFFDGDGIIIVRSMGIAPTIHEAVGPVVRCNSVVVFETRFQRRRLFELAAPLVVQGKEVDPSETALFQSDSFWIDGGPDRPGLGVVDTELTDGFSPVDQILSGLDAGQRERINGRGQKPSVEDITAAVSGNPERNQLLSPGYLLDFAARDAQKVADRVFDGDQRWLGTNDAGLRTDEPGVTVVNGNLEILGDVSGAGVLLVRGKIFGTGSLSFDGLVLAIGAGELDASVLRLEVSGGMYVVRVEKWGMDAVFGIPRFSLGARTLLRYDGEAIGNAVRLLPPLQTGFREVTTTMDPPWP